MVDKFFLEIPHVATSILILLTIPINHHDKLRCSSKINGRKTVDCQQTNIIVMSILLISDGLEIDGSKKKSKSFQCVSR